MSGAIVAGKTDRKNGKHMKVGDKIKRIRQFRGMTQHITKRLAAIFRNPEKKEDGEKKNETRRGVK